MVANYDCVLQNDQLSCVSIVVVSHDYGLQDVSQPWSDVVGFRCGRLFVFIHSL